MQRYLLNQEGIPQPEPWRGKIKQATAQVPVGWGCVVESERHLILVVDGRVNRAQCVYVCARLEAGKALFLGDLERLRPLCSS
jgi:hypothetical protein